MIWDRACSRRIFYAPSAISVHGSFRQASLEPEPSGQVVVVVVGLQANCPLVEPQLIGGMPSPGVFLRDPSPYLLKFRRKPRKIPNG